MTCAALAVQADCSCHGMEVDDAIQEMLARVALQ
jgi:hypothetical protein